MLSFRKNVFWKSSNTTEWLVVEVSEKQICLKVEERIAEVIAVNEVWVVMVGRQGVNMREKMQVERDVGRKAGSIVWEKW